MLVSVLVKKKKSSSAIYKMCVNSSTSRTHVRDLSRLCKRVPVKHGQINRRLTLIGLLQHVLIAMFHFQVRCQIFLFSNDNYSLYFRIELVAQFLYLRSVILVYGRVLLQSLLSFLVFQCLFFLFLRIGLHKCTRMVI